MLKRRPFLFRNGDMQPHPPVQIKPFDLADRRMKVEPHRVTMPPSRRPPVLSKPFDQVSGHQAQQGSDDR